MMSANDRFFGRDIRDPPDFIDVSDLLIDNPTKPDRHWLNHFWKNCNRIGQWVIQADINSYLDGRKIYFDELKQTLDLKESQLVFVKESVFDAVDDGQYIGPFRVVQLLNNGERAMLSNGLETSIEYLIGIRSFVQEDGRPGKLLIVPKSERESCAEAEDDLLADSDKEDEPQRRNSRRALGPMSNASYS